MNVLSQVYTLHNGVEIPKVAFGTWQITNEEAYQAVADALSAGYRHIDTAKSYHNEEAVGRAIRDSGTPRDEIFVTTKLRAPALGYEETLKAFEEQRLALGLEYIDMYLIHAPWAWGDRGNPCTQANIQAWKAMESLYHAKKVRAIGVSNFLPSDLQALIVACEIVPMVDQVRYFVGYTQRDTVAFCKEHGILIEAYSPLATGKVFIEGLFQEIADRNHVTVAQLCLRYCLQKGVLPLPKTKTKSRMVENGQLDFMIPEQDMALLDGIIDEGSRLGEA